MKKRVAALCMGTFVLMAVHAFAETSIEGVQIADGRSVTVEIITEPYERVAVKVQQKNGALLGFVGEQEANEDGKVIFEFLMSDAAPDGEYILSYCEGENDAARYPFGFADITVFLRKLNEAVSKEELLQLLHPTSGNTYVAEVMGIDTEQYYALAEEEQLRLLEQYLTLREGATQKENLDAFSKAMGIQISDRNKEKALKLYNPEFEGVTFNQLADDTKKQWIIEVLNVSEKTPEGFERAYGQAQVIFSLSYAKSVEVGALIGNYGTILGLANSSQYAKYTNLSVGDKGKVHDYIVENITGAKTAQEVLGIFENAVNSIGTQGNNSGGGGIGGNRSSGTSGAGRSGDIVIGSDFISSNGNEIKPAFSDLEGYDWAEKEICFLAEKNIISGYGDGCFRPGQVVTREEFVKMAVCAAGIYNADAECSFADVESGAWYYRYIASGVESGIIDGIGDGLFGTETTMTRQDMSVIVCRLAEKRGLSLVQKRSYANYNDEAAISDYAKESVKKLYTAGMINGVSENGFAPLEQTTRAQAAKILYDVFYNGEGTN